MTEPRMPTTLPSPVDRGEFRFVEEMVWVRVAAGTEPDETGTDGCCVVH